MLGAPAKPAFAFAPLLHLLTFVITPVLTFLLPAPLLVPVLQVPLFDPVAAFVLFFLFFLPNCTCPYTSAACGHAFFSA